MHASRILTHEKRYLALLFVALALSVKALVPTGYMISDTSRVLTVSICNGDIGSLATTQIEIPAKGSPYDEQSHGKVDGHCPYSSLSMVAMGGASAPLLALAFAFILALGFAPAKRLPFGQIRYLRPPLRGPPAAA